MATQGQKLAAAGTAILVSESALALAHTGSLGVIVGLVLGVAAYASLDDVEQQVGMEDPSLPAPKAKEPGQRSLAYRLLNGKSTRGEQLQEEVETDEIAASETTPDAVPQDQASTIPPQFKLNDVIEVVRRANKAGCVYFGQSTEMAIGIRYRNMYHVMDVSSSGKGKSNRFRLAMMQMVGTHEVYYINPLANDVKAVEDERQVEVWKPIFDRLANGRPMKEGPEIFKLMTDLVDEIEIRSEREGAKDFSWRQEPIFVFIDELPEVFVRCPEAIKLLDKIGRTGRQFCVFSWVASQTAAVGEIGQSTAAQANYKTRIYGGGDRNSSNRLMKGSLPSDTERMLQANGAGLTMMIADELPDLQFVRAPLVTNEALFEYMGLPPFRMEDWIGSSEKVTHRLSSLHQQDNSEDPGNLLPFHLSPKKETPQAQKPAQSIGERVKGERGKRVKGPNEGSILEALDALEGEGKALTLNAIAKKAGLTWHHYDEIETVAIECGYELDRGRGRPKSADSEREA
jgi:hypothetical protein